MTLTAVKPGGWDPEEVLTSDDMSALQALILKAIDGTGGGFYTIIADLEIAGAAVIIHNAILHNASVEDGALIVAADSTFDFQGDGEISGDVDLTGLVNITDECHVQAGALLRIDGSGFLTAAAGSTVTLGGTVTISSTLADLTGILNVVGPAGRIDVEDQGVISVLGGATGGRINLASGAKIVASAGAEIQVAATDDIVINAAPFEFRVPLTPCAMTKTSNVDDFAPLAAALPVWVQHQVVGSAPEISFAIPIMPGDTITTLRLWVHGEMGAGHSSPPGMPKFLLYKLNSSGLATLLCEFFDDVDTLPAYDTLHTITLNSGVAGSLLPYTVGSGELLFAVIRGETGVDAVADTTGYLAIDGTGLARHYRNVSEVH